MEDSCPWIIASILKSWIESFIPLINLSQIQNYFDGGKFLPNETINLSYLKKNKVMAKKYKQLKLLGKGEIKNKVQIEINSISNSAKNKIEKSGGKIIMLSNKK